MHSRAVDLIATLNLKPHPEGGFYRELFRSSLVVMPADRRGSRAALTTIYFLLTAETWSRWHQVRSDEAWHLYEGGPLELLELEIPTRLLERRRLAAVGDGDASPAHVVAADRWQAARCLGDYALMGCAVGPGFDFADFRLLRDDAAAALVREEWPDLAFLV